EIGLIIKFGLFSGLREEELLYVHNKPICPNLGLQLRQTPRNEQTKRDFSNFNPMASWTQKMLFLTHANKNVGGI
ncbi:MAG TPA: hypothetical protein VKA91_02515, partial [Nitrososphaeraceae archaeon]|nr:hypothetical protein [Nitrososphaeraceae archaeon]